jgi:UDP-N-acetylglucosamine 2-epimerase (non-hydrolysing)
VECEKKLAYLVPCVTLRDNTEREEIIDVGSNMLAGINPDRILEAVKLMVSRKKGWVNPLGMEHLHRI